MLKDSALLRAMKKRNISVRDYALAQGWSLSTAYRRVRGDKYHLDEEVARAKAILDLSDEKAREIFGHKQ